MHQILDFVRFSSGKLISNLYILYGSSHMQVLKTEIWNECHKNVWVVSILFYELC